MDLDFEISDYVETISKAKSVEDLRQAVLLLEDLGKSASKQVEAMVDADMEEFHRGYEICKQEEGFPGEEWMNKYACIIMPPETFPLIQISHEYGAPLGVVYHQWKRLRGEDPFETEGL